MAKRSPQQDLAKFDGPTNLPAFLEDEVDDTSLDVMRDHRILPRLKVVQGTSKQELIEQFGAGSVIVQPGNIEVVKKEVSFLAVPVLFFVEYCKWSDLKDEESPAVVDRTFDPTSELAKISRDAKKREEVYQGDEDAKKPKIWRYVEHLNFVCFIYNEDSALRGEPVVQSFSRGEYGTGQGFINACSMRRSPLWSQVWQVKPAYRDKGAERKWYGLDWTAPPEDIGPHIKADQKDFFKDAHVAFKDLQEKKRLIVDHSEKEDSDVEEAVEVIEEDNPNF